MPNSDPARSFLFRDGTSQAGRALAALDPRSVAVDERGLTDWLGFLKQFAGQLQYFNLEDKPEGTWAGLFPFSEEQLAEVAGFVENPEKYGDPRYDAFRRPHFALLLTFLQILRPVRDRVNQFTRRHLDFYHREVLQFAPKPGVSGRVHVVIEPVADQEPFLLSAGTLLAAGPDGQGGEVRYQTDQDIVVNRAQVTRIMSIHVERQIIGLRDIRRNPDLLRAVVGEIPSWWDTRSLKERLFLALLQVAIGTPNPGNDLPAYRRQNGDLLPINERLLLELDQLLRFLPETLGLTLPAFRDLMNLRHRLDIGREEVQARWDEVNQTLKRAGGNRPGNPGAAFILPPEHPDDFEGNLSKALGLDPATAYLGLEEINDIYGLERRVNPDDPKPNKFNEFVTDANAGLAMPSLSEFKIMMGVVNEFYASWRRVQDILRAAARRKGHTEAVSRVNLRSYDADRWRNLLWAYLGPLSRAAYPTLNNTSLVDWGASEEGAGDLEKVLDQAEQELGNLKEAFYLPAEDFVRARLVNADDHATPWQWAEVDGLLSEARLQLALAQRRTRLIELGRGKPTIREGVQAMVLAALADPEHPDQLPDSQSGESFFDLTANDAEYIREHLLLTIEEVRSVQTVAQKPVPTEDDRDLVARILDQPLRHRLGWSPPALEFVVWQNLFAAADATKLRVGEIAKDASASRWRTFGTGPQSGGINAPGALGWMIASPVLALAEGERTITLTFRFAEEGFDAGPLADAGDPVKTPFRFLLSTAKGMIDVPLVKLTDPPAGTSPPATRELRLVIFLDPQTPSITPLPPGFAFPVAQPLLQVLLKDFADPARPDVPPTKKYEAFRKLIIESIGLEVEVEGLTGLHLQNDDAVLSPTKPFEPFGLAPAPGSRFVFAHPEVCAKRLDELTLEADWMGVPADLDTYYQGYSGYSKGKDAANTPLPDRLVKSSFHAGLKLYDRRLALSLKDVPLFGNTSSLPEGLVRCAYSLKLDEIKAKYSGYAPTFLDASDNEPLAWSRNWALELGAPDFQHSVYPVEAFRAALTKDKDGNPAPVVLNPPYTPRIKQLRLAYHASVELSPVAAAATDPDQFYHIEPFGYRPAARIAGSGWPLLPQCDNEGELYLGVIGANPPQNLSLLFQMAAGSADPELPPERVRWSYLSDNQWRDLDDRHLLSDTTRGLLNTGLIQFDLPPGQPGTLLPPGFFWIRASVANHSRAIADLNDVRTQAVSASRVEAGVGPAASGHTLPPNQVTGLVEPRPEVKAIHQPFSSFGGSPPEAESAFALRVSERLRHKDRALTCWDYERLVLEAFPDIYKVKCLPVDALADPAQASQVQVIVVPDIRGRRPFDPFEPKVSADTLRDIETFLADRSAALARIQVRNPLYCTLQLRFSVRLRPGYNPGFHLARLNEDVCRYLSPWAYDGSSDIVFGGRLSANLIVYFIEQRPYVDYVAGMRLFLRQDDRELVSGSADDVDLTELDGGAPDVIVVSALHHQIDLIQEERYEPESFIGINYMTIELDFRVADQDAPTPN